MCDLHTGRVVFSGKSVADLAHTRRQIQIEGCVAGDGGAAYVTAHSSPTGSRGVALRETVS